MDQRHWREFDLSGRCAKIEYAFRREPIRTAEDLPLVINTPCYFGFGNRPMPPRYWNDPAVMVRHQEEGFARHLAAVDDDTVPYFMPWFGTGVLASAFGCPVKEATGRGDDPGVCGPAVASVGELAKLKAPDPERDGLMPRVLQFIEYAREHSDLPVGLTDMNSPLSTAAQICGYDKLFTWMYDEPRAVHELLDLVTTSFIEWTRLQKARAGDALDSSNGLQGVWSPKGVGVWVSDDDLVSIGPDLYEEFVVPINSRIFEAFGGGHLHFCGNGLHQVPNLLKTRNLRAVNNSPLGNFPVFHELARKLGGRVTIQIQDAAPIEVEHYYAALFEGVANLRGVMLATFVEDNLGVTMAGATKAVDRDPIETARRIVRAIRDIAQKKLDQQERER